MLVLRGLNGVQELQTATYFCTKLVYTLSNPNISVQGTVVDPDRAVGPEPFSLRFPIIL